MNNRNSLIVFGLLALCIIGYFVCKNNQNTDEQILSQLKDFEPRPDSTLKLPIDSESWSQKEYKYNHLTKKWDLVSTKKATVTKNVLILENNPKNKDTVSRRYIVEYNTDIDNTILPTGLKSVGFHVEIDRMKATKDTNPFVSILVVDSTFRDTLISDDTDGDSINDYNYYIKSKKWNDYQIKDSTTPHCKNDIWKSCRILENNGKERNRAKKVSIGAINDMSIYKGNKIRVQFMIESKGNEVGKSYINIKEVSFYYYTKTEGEIFTDLMKTDSLSKILKDKKDIKFLQAHDDGQSGPRVPPRD